MAARTPMCPSCFRKNSYPVADGSKGFGIGKAAVGAVLVGPLGALAGFSTKKKLHWYCPDCGKTFIHK